MENLLLVSCDLLFFIQFIVCYLLSLVDLFKYSFCDWIIYLNTLLRMVHLCELH